MFVHLSGNHSYVSSVYLGRWVLRAEIAIVYQIIWSNFIMATFVILNVFLFHGATACQFDLHKLKSQIIEIHNIISLFFIQSANNEFRNSSKHVNVSRKSSLFKRSKLQKLFLLPRGMKLNQPKLDLIMT